MEYSYKRLHSVGALYKPAVASVLVVLTGSTRPDVRTFSRLQMSVHTFITWNINKQNLTCIFLYKSEMIQQNVQYH